MSEGSSRVDEVLEAIRSLNRDELNQLVERIRESQDRKLRAFRILLANPWMGERFSSILIQAFWVIIASLSLIAGIYMLTPAFTVSEGGYEYVSEFLKAIAERPEIIGVADPIIKLMGFAMLLVAVGSFYQAHLIRRAYEYRWGEE